MIKLSEDDEACALLLAAQNKSDVLARALEIREEWRQEAEDVRATDEDHYRRYESPAARNGFLDFDPRG